MTVLAQAGLVCDDITALRLMGAARIAPENLTSKGWLYSEVLAWAKRIGVEPREIRIRPMKRKWGSSSTAGRLTLSGELLARPAEFRKKIIVHELFHLKVPNHGRFFKSLVAAYLHLPKALFARVEDYD